MKTKLLAILLVTAYFSSSYAAVRAEEVRTYSFKFKNISSPIELKASSYEEAYEKAAFNCMAQLKGSSDKKLTEDQKLDLIDICANPKS